MVFRYVLAASAAVIPFVNAQCTTTTMFPAPTKPASDPFWQAPSDLNSRASGSVFNCRQVNWNKVNGSQAYYQYAYKTVRKDGVSAVAVATLLIPDGTPAGAQFTKLLSYQVPYDSPTSFCGPSFVNQPGSGGDTTNTYGISVFGPDQSPTQALLAGIPVVISDYETNYASFTVGVTSGLATLNGIRAVIQSSGFFKPSPQVALWGYSGGALATEFALELAGTQATDLTIIGAALGGLTPIARNVALMVNGFHSSGNFAQSFYNALIPYAALGLANENATLNSWILANLRDTSEPNAPNQATYRSRFLNAKSDMCNTKTGPDYVNSNFNNWFTGLPASGSLFDVPTVSDALNVYGIMGQTGSNSRTTPKPPLYFYKGTADEVSAVADTTNLFNKYCAANARITYVQYLNQNHGDTESKGMSAAWSYLQARFAGTPVSSACSQTTTVVS